jgi:type IV secretory pathway VirB2 component (pilin)
MKTEIFMESIPDTAIILIIIGLAIALPWLLFLAADKRGRSEAGNVWQHSLETIQKTLRGEAKELDELSRQVQKIKEEAGEEKRK